MSYQPSDAIRVAVAPAATYRELAAAADAGSWQRALKGPAFAGFLFATCMSVIATAAASLPTILSVALCWLFVPATQLVGAWLMCRRSLTPGLGAARAIELQFLAHAPWSLWLIGVAFASIWFPPGSLLTLIVATVLVPAVLTMVILASFCRSVLCLDAREARRRTAAHQFALWTLIAIYALLSIQPWARMAASP